MIYRPLHSKIIRIAEKDCKTDNRKEIFYQVFHNNTKICKIDERSVKYMLQRSCKFV
jgi:hypothetical protein